MTPLSGGPLRRCMLNDAQASNPSRPPLPFTPILARRWRRAAANLPDIVSLPGDRNTGGFRTPIGDLNSGGPNALSTFTPPESVSNPVGQASSPSRPVAKRRGDFSMKTIKVYRYRCEFCRRSFSNRNTAINHEPHCFKNERRIPWTGELCGIFDDGKPGQIFNGTGWEDVPGYSCENGSDHWPEFHDKSLAEWPARTRLDMLKPQEAFEF